MLPGILAATVFLALPAPPGEAIGWVRDSESPGGWAIEIELPDDWPLDRIEDWQTYATVRVPPDAGAVLESLPPLAGRWTLGGEGLRFRPRFAFVPDLPVHVHWRISELARRLDHTPAPPDRRAVLTPPPSPPRTPPAVVGMLPTGPVIAANLLRVYLHFSQPMRPHGAGHWIRLVDESGDEVQLPFVDIPEGLWDPSRTRLTVLFHPGRLKTGVAPNRQTGLPLDEGRVYRLRVEAGMPDAAGTPLPESIEFELRPGPADRTSPRPSEWIVTPPPGPQAPLHVGFEAPVDPVLAARLIDVETDAGRPVLGSWSVDSAGSAATFEPSTPWENGRYALAVDPRLEDSSGNRIDGPFEIESEKPPLPESPVRVPFQVRRGSRD